MQRARSKKGSSFEGARALGVGGWLLVLPLALGAYLGWYIDKSFGGGFLWTLLFMALGLAVGLFNLWHFYTGDGK